MILECMVRTGISFPYPRNGHILDDASGRFFIDVVSTSYTVSLGKCSSIASSSCVYSWLSPSVINTWHWSNVGPLKKLGISIENSHQKIQVFWLGRKALINIYMVPGDVFPDMVNNGLFSLFESEVISINSTSGYHSYKLFSWGKIQTIASIRCWLLVIWNSSLCSIQYLNISCCSPGKQWRIKFGIDAVAFV